jgi:hypothetical protein
MDTNPKANGITNAKSNSKAIAKVSVPSSVPTNLESWRLVWREGFVPVVSTAALESLREALESDDARLTQGSTTTPPPLMCVQDWPVEAACALGFCGWQGENLETVGQVEEFFARLCYEADQRLGEPAACRWFLNWFDDTPRHDMRRELLGEVQRALAERLPFDRVANPTFETGTVTSHVSAA